MKGAHGATGAFAPSAKRSEAMFSPASPQSRISLPENLSIINGRAACLLVELGLVELNRDELGADGRIGGLDILDLCRSVFQVGTWV